jgi:IgGFc binding protein
MNHSRRSGFIAALSCGVIASAFACSSREGFDTSSKSFDSNDAGGPAASCIHCSRDLKQVLDGCDGDDTAKVVATCNADQGCGAGTCVDPCAAAALNQGSVGCEFWTLPPADQLGANAKTARGSCFAATIANTWDRAVNISAEFRGAPLDISKSTYRARREGEVPVYEPIEGPLPPGEVALVFLAHVPEKDRIVCPLSVTPALSIDPIGHNTTINDAFHIKTDAPVSAYSISPYGGATSYEPTATLLLPVSSWSKNYIAIQPGFEQFFPYLDYQLPPSQISPRTLQIVASEDDTQVSIRPTVEVWTNEDVPGTHPGVPQTWTLAKGQVLQFVQESMSGSPIESTKPIGVFGGSWCTTLPGNYGACDMLQQQIPAPAQWGTEYAVVPYPSRTTDRGTTYDARELTLYTVVGGADGTELTYEPARPDTAPVTLRAGEMVGFGSDVPFVVKSQDSQHPFHVNVYMTGANYLKTLTGDPDFVNVPAAAQYLDRYVFFTDFTFPETQLTMVRRKTSRGFVPVELSCGGEITGWKPLGSSGMYEYAWVNLTTKFTEPLSKEGCSSYGRQEAHSEGPFAITVWGLGYFASYGYVAGTGLRPANDAAPVPVK